MFPVLNFYSNLPKKIREKSLNIRQEKTNQCVVHCSQWEIYNLDILQSEAIHDVTQHYEILNAFTGSNQPTGQWMKTSRTVLIIVQVASFSFIVTVRKLIFSLAKFNCRRRMSRHIPPSEYDWRFLSAWRVNDELYPSKRINSVSCRATVFSPFGWGFSVEPKLNKSRSNGCLNWINSWNDNIWW